MSVQDELTAAFGELQAVFSETAVIAGFTVPVVRGESTQLGEAIEQGGVIYTQVLSLFFAVAGNPAPAVEQIVVFAGLTYRVWRVEQNVANWHIDLLQLTQA